MTWFTHRSNEAKELEYGTRQGIEVIQSLATRVAHPLKTFHLNNNDEDKPGNAQYGRASTDFAKKKVVASRSNERRGLYGAVGQTLKNETNQCAAKLTASSAVKMAVKKISSPSNAF